MPGNKLYVGNITYSVTSDQLQELFSSHGEVKNVTIINGKGFGFVEMGSDGDADKAKEALNGFEFQGRTLKVDEARPPKENRDGGDGRNFRR